MIRPFYGKKYGTDIVTDALRILKHSETFKKCKFTVFGKGAITSALYREFGGMENFNINEGFLTQGQIKEFHSKNGVFLVLSRQDAQGVSMCEAMSSGLVPITSNNTAIPEFVIDGFSGILTDNDPKKVAAAIQKVANDGELFENLSENAGREIVRIAGIESVVQREIDLIEQNR